MQTNPQWLKCAACEGDGKSRTDATESCAVCGGIGSLIFCTCCLSHQQYDGHVPGVCRSCRGDAHSSATQANVTFSHALAQLGEQWRVEHRRVALEELRPSLVMVSP